MFNVIFQKLFKPKTLDRLERTTRKFVAGITILMSVFYGTLYYALITLASEDDGVPKPLVNQAFDLQKEPEKFFLESLAERKSSKIKNLASISSDEYQEFELENKKVFEPTVTKIKNKLYVPFRLVVASSSSNLEVEFKSKKGIQKIILQNGSFDYAIFEKQKKNFTKLADMKNVFQFSELAPEPTIIQPPAESPVSTPESSTNEAPIITVEPPPSESPDSMNSPQAAPVFSTEPTAFPVESPTSLPTEPGSETSGTSSFGGEAATESSTTGETPVPSPEVAPEATPTQPEATPEPSPQSFFNQLFNTATAADAQGFGSQIWQEVLLSGPVGPATHTDVRYGVSTSWAIDNQLLTINQEEDFSLGTVSFSAWARIKLGYENSQHVNSWEYGVSRSDGLALENYVFRLKYDATLAAAVKSKNESTGELELTIEKDEDQPSVEIADIESELSEAEESQTDEAIPEPAPTINPEEQPTSLNNLLNELLGIETARADESPVVEPAPASAATPTDSATQEVEPPHLEVPLNDGSREENVEQTSISEEQDNLEAELPSDELPSEGGQNETAVSEEQAPDTLVESVTNVIDTITDGVSSFVNNPSISTPAIESANLEAQPLSEEVEPLEPTVEETDLSEPPLPPQPLTAQIIDAISALNPLPQTETFDFKLNFNFSPANADNIVLDEKTGHLTALISLLAPDAIVPTNVEEAAPSAWFDFRKILGIQTVHAQTEAGGTNSSMVLATISDIGVVVYDDGIWVASGDGSKGTDFKIHFNPTLGGAIDQLYLGTDFATNKVAKPQARLNFQASAEGTILQREPENLGGQASSGDPLAESTFSSGGLTLIEQDGYSQAETQSVNLEVIEQSKVRIVIDNTFKLGPEASVAERWAIYATGRIIKQIIYDKQKAGEERWYLNAAKTGAVETGVGSFDLPAGYNYNQLILNTRLEPNSKDLMLVWQDPSLLTSSSFEAGEVCAGQTCAEGGDSFITVAKLNRNPWTYTQYQMIDLMREDLSMVDKTAIDERAADYRNPDKPEFALGRFIQVNKQFQSYEMESAANQNRVIFKMDGSQTPRFQPVFEIHDWENPDLAAVKAALNQRSMLENRDYIVDFRNGDPSTGILVFHFLGTLRVNSEFSADGFGVFDIDPEVAPGGGVLMYGDGAEVSISTVTTNSTGNLFGAFASVSAGTIDPFWVVNRASPVGGSQASGSDNEHLAGNLNGVGVLEMLRWNGTTWALDWTENNVGSQSLDTRAFDIAYETSGEAVAAWASTSAETGKLEYRVWNGISWGASASFAIPTTMKVTWVEMASHPASGSSQNEIGLCYATGGPDASVGTLVGCAIWDGDTNTWGNTKLQESNADENGTVTGGSKTMAVFYEQSSGQLVAAWGFESTGNTTAEVLGTTTWDTATGWAATAGFAFGTNGDSASTMVCASLPTVSATIKNKAVCVNHHQAQADTNATIWSGTALGQAPNTGGIDTFSIAGATARISIAATWLIGGTNRVAVVAWGSSDSADVDWIAFDDAAGTWTTVQSFAHTTGTDNNYVFANSSFTNSSNPDRKNTTMLFLVDSNSDLFAYEASVSATTVTFATMNNGIAITFDLAVTNGLPVMMAYDMFPNPTQIHYQWRNDDGTLATATSAAAEDTQLTGLALNTVKRLRVEISNEGTATDSSNFQLEFAKKGTGCTEPTLSAGWRYREIRPVANTASDAFDIELSANFANGDPTADGDTVSLTNEDPTFVAGQGIESASSTSAITLNGNNFTEIEFALQSNANSQVSTNYCFRITDGGSSTSYTYKVYSEVQTAAAAAGSPTYTQDFFRFYVNANVLTPTDPWPSVGGADLAENATMSAHFASVASGSIARVRTNVLVSTATLNAASQTFQFQYAEGFKCGAIAGGSWAAVGASTSDTIWRFGSNAGVTDGTTLASPVLLSNSTDGARATYEEGNPSAINPNAVTAAQRMEHDWSLQNNGAVSGASYCFRIIRPSGTVFETYNRFPLIVLGPSTDQVLRHGAFFSEGYEQGYYWSGL